MAKIIHGEAAKLRRENDRLKSRIAELTSMTARDNIAQHSRFVLHDEVYIATAPITKGSEIRPGYNCTKGTLD